ncbi:uncharacterized protein si:dkey-195m11.11 [Pseudorasbora parva]|uniref:uncharacterized protein si:dkey-195m11.11 n=1 Tax=Pseudorasbora parva TaxID=51549 RepID=UPI00351E8514
MVCWYQSTRPEPKNSYSQFSNPLPLFVSALPPPKVSLKPNLFLVGGNYTVYCNSAAGPVTNFTLILYYRTLPVTRGTNWTTAGSVFLTNSNSIFLQQTNAVIPIEFACTMEMLYNGKMLRSPQSKSEQAFPEELPVRLWEQDRGESCLGYLDVKLKGKWEPVCQKEVDSVVNASAVLATAKVVCRELRCGHVLGWKSILKNERPFSKIIGGIRCSGNEEKTRDCPMNDIELCENMGFLYIICSDALPPPKLSVITYDPVSELYVKDKENVEISCSIDSTYLKPSDNGYMLFRKDGAVLREFYSKPGSSVSMTLYAKVQEGEYDCAYQLYSSKNRQVSQPSNTVFIYIYNPPNPVPIVAGVLTTVVGVAILTYVCICRTTKEKIQGNELPAHSQDPATNTENPDNNVHIPQQL